MRKLIISFSTIVLVIFMIIVMGCVEKKNRVTSAINNAGEKGFVVMELFTSQGCSSCPPADEILGNYAMKNDEHIIPIAFHVDYWDRLGWIDSFSNSKYTQRQHDYAAKFNLESVYTPQLIVNGQKEMVGSGQERISTVVDNYLKENAAVMISISNPAAISNKVVVFYTLSTLQPNTSINGALIQDKVVTQIKAGENRGVELNNYNVARDFITIPLSDTFGKITLQLPKGSITSGYSIVLFVQDNASRKITGAARVKL